ncbi:hypothetical protein BJV77DRAFT_1038620 [Russula vinacea]|nr:hypothetical protein BJV77DRAFT_1038620 [Russula vinacea]
MDPIQTFQHETISVLTNSSGHVTLEAAGQIRLEGESVVGASIQGIPNLRCFVLRSWLRWLSPDTTFTQISSAAGVLIPDWTEPIHQIILITDNPSLWGSRIGTVHLENPPRLPRGNVGILKRSLN